MTAPDPRLDEIQARLSAATPGPWFQGREGKRYEDTRDVYTEREVSATSRDIGRIDYPEDAALIANAPTDVAFLLTELRKAREALTAVEVLAESWRYKGEFGWGAWQEGHGPDMEGTILDDVSRALRAAVAAAKGDERG